MNKTTFQLVWTAVCWGPVLLFLALRWLESRREASKRTDPPKGADEPTMAKSVQGDDET